MIIFNMNQFCVLRNHFVKFGENWITFHSNPYIKSPLEIYLYAYKWLKNIDSVMKFGMNMYFLNLNLIIKFCYTHKHN